MNRNSNTYIILYASVMVIVVALILSFAAMKLKEKQDNNVRMEKMSDILRSIDEGAEMNTVSDKFAYIDEQYNKYITNSYTVNTAGEVTDEDAFNVLLNLKSEYDKAPGERNLPVFESTSDDGSMRYILPVWGSGLWGPVWGYVALESDWNTIYRALFDHQGETPGLGAEIATPPFQDQFNGKMVFDGDRLVGISVLKGSGSSTGNIHAVDAISGGTITSRAVETMIKNGLDNYSAYITKKRAGNDTEVLPVEEFPVIDSLTVN